MSLNDMIFEIFVMEAEDSSKKSYQIRFTAFFIYLVTEGYSLNQVQVG